MKEALRVLQPPLLPLLVVCIPCSSASCCAAVLHSSVLAPCPSVAAFPAPAITYGPVCVFAGSSDLPER